jgi:hypothetical protein
MNIVEIIKVYVSGPVLTQLSSLIGTTESTTRSAVGATVPSLLSSFSSLASTPSGGQKLIGALQRFDPRSGPAAAWLNERPDILAERGAGMAESLLGSGGVSGIVDSLTRSYGISTGGANRLLGFLTPTLLGAIARQFSGTQMTPGALGSFFSEQRAQLAAAAPVETSRPEPVAATPMGRIRGTARAFARPAAPRGRWMLPAVLALAAIALMVFATRPRHTQQEPEPADETTKLGLDLRETVGSVTGALSEVRDTVTAETALPKIEQAKGRVEEIRARAAQLPPDAKSRFDQMVQPQVQALQRQSERVASIPGASEKIKPVLDDLISRMSAPLSGTPAESQEVR